MQPAIFDNTSDPKVDIKVEDTSSPQQVGFSFVVTQKLALLLVGSDAQLTFTVGAEVKATFSQTESTKRNIEQANEFEATTLSAEVQLDESVKNIDTNIATDTRISPDTIFISDSNVVIPGTLGDTNVNPDTNVAFDTNAPNTNVGQTDVPKANSSNNNTPGNGDNISSSLVIASIFIVLILLI